MTKSTTPAELKFDRSGLDDDFLRQLYLRLLLPRMIEEKMLKLLRQGKITKWFSGIGQEAISVGVMAALQPDEFVFPMHRNLGVFTGRDIPLERLFCQWQGKAAGFTQGRDRSFHFGAPDYHIVGMISHLGPQLALADGVGLGYTLADAKKVAVAFTGEGGTSEGDFHEALNVAAVWKLPVIFIIENNGYGLSTPTSEQYACRRLSDRAKGYGMPGVTIAGNNVLEVYRTIDKWARKLRKKPGPVLIECETFRMRGHEEASGTKYVPQEYFDKWAPLDPLDNYEQFLIQEAVITADETTDWRAANKAAIEAGLQAADKQPVVTADTAIELADRYLPADALVAPQGESTELRFIDAISQGLEEGMQRWPELVLMGQDIADYGGVFKITQGFVERFGAERVRNTPLCESAILGVGLGLSLVGGKSMVEMQFGDFVSCGFNQIVNNLAKLHYRWGHAPQICVRLPVGGGVGAGPFHSQTMEGWFMQVPGLKIVYPSTPEDAKGLLLAALADPNPVLFFEHKALYRGLSGPVPAGYYTTPIGQAKVVREGRALTVATYGMGVHWAQEVVAEKGIDAEIIDLRTLLPLDEATLLDSVQKTHRVLVLHEASLTAGPGAEIAAWISEHAFEYLDAPVLRVASLDTPVPFATALEENYLPRQRLQHALDQLVAY